MVDPRMCVYCLALAEYNRSRARRIHRCPLCKTEIGCTGDGERFRLGAQRTTAPLRWHSLALATGIGATALLAIVAVRMFSTQRDTTSAQSTPSQHAQPAPAVETPTSGPPPLAVVKGPAQFGLAAAYRAASVRPRPVAKASPLPVPVSEPVPVASPLVRPPAASPPSTQQNSAAVLVLNVPEVALEPRGDEPNHYAAKQHIADVAKTIQDKGPDAFIDELITTRPDLAGLPFRRGDACRLDAAATASLRTGSLLVRRALDRLRAPSHSGSIPSSHPAHDARAFWDSLGPRRDLSALQQILAVEDGALRQSLAEKLGGINDQRAATALARLAIFDPDEVVRRVAVEGLTKVHQAEYDDELIQAFRHPWPAIASRAADAITTLARHHLADRLVDFLDEPDPADPLPGKRPGWTDLVVREMVRINHHRNCFLCHPPAQTPSRADIIALRNDVVGPVPSPAEPLPRSSTLYYSVREDQTAVRASVTYLRQDFSMLQPVQQANPWPELQRFDFLVRTRELTGAEVVEFQKRKAARVPNYISEQHQSGLRALRALTGLDLGRDSDAWRRALVRR
jgi:hypothetical protein